MWLLIVLKFFFKFSNIRWPLPPNFSSPNLLYKWLKSLFLGVTDRSAFFLWYVSSSPQVARNSFKYCWRAVDGVWPDSYSLFTFSIHSRERSRKLDALSVSSEWFCSHSTSTLRWSLTSILTIIWKGQLVFLTRADGSTFSFRWGSLDGLHLRVLRWHL